MQRIFIPDFGMGNLHSIRKSLLKNGIEPVISADPADISSADKVILPGVGHFATAMNNLAALNMIDALDKFALHQKKPVLGICLGMQLMGQYSEEGNQKGLGWIEGNVVRMKAINNLTYKIPHIGWNEVIFSQQHPLFSNINKGAEFYFIHSYHFVPTKDSQIAGRTTYGSEFISAVIHENIFGVQFHPEKSHTTGALLIKNFIDYKC